MKRKLHENAYLLYRWARQKLDVIPVKSDELIEQKNKAMSLPACPEHQKEIPVWRQQDIAPEIKKQALQALFRQPQINCLDGLNDYDEDFTRFDELGELVTEQMQRMMRLAEAKSNADDHAKGQVILAEKEQKDKKTGLDGNQVAGDEQSA